MAQAALLKNFPFKKLSAEILANTHGRLIGQHDPDDFKALPAPPKYLN